MCQYFCLFVNTLPVGQHRLVVLREVRRAVVHDMGRGRGGEKSFFDLHKLIGMFAWVCKIAFKQERRGYFWIWFLLALSWDMYWQINPLITFICGSIPSTCSCPYNRPDLGNNCHELGARFWYFTGILDSWCLIGIYWTHTFFWNNYGKVKPIDPLSQCDSGVKEEVIKRKKLCPN